ncbi:MAG: hypothetical protein U0Y10_12480 [Spirosomataceae bacterium]
MSNSLISKALKTNKVLFKAGAHIVKTSFKTTRSLAGLYKNAGTKAFGIGKNLLQETVKLAAENQKDVKETSVKALKEATEIIRQRHKAAAENVAISPEVPVKKAAKKAKKADVSIDDLLKD